MLASDQVEESVKDHLRETFDQLNPVELKREITRLQAVLIKCRAERNVLITDVAAEETATSI